MPTLRGWAVETLSFRVKLNSEMKNLLAMNLPWLPLPGGADKGNRAKAARGHEVRAVVTAVAAPALPRAERWGPKGRKEGVCAR